MPIELLLVAFTVVTAALAVTITALLIMISANRN